MDKVKCAKCGKELNQPKSENWDLYCGVCITPAEMLKKVTEKKK